MAGFHHSRNTCLWTRNIDLRCFNSSQKIQCKAS